MTVVDLVDVLRSDGDDGGHGNDGEEAVTAPNLSSKLRRKGEGRRGIEGGTGQG